MALISNRQASIRIRVMAGSAVAARAMPHSRSTGIIISQNPVRQNILRRRRRRSSSLTVRPLALTASSQVIQTGLSGCRSGMRRFRRVLCWPSIWRQRQANATHFPVSPSVTGENDPGIGGGTQREAGGRQGEAETVTVHAQRFQEDLSPCRTPAAGSDVYAVHQR